MALAQRTGRSRHRLVLLALTAITLMVALVADFLFLPPLLIWLAGEKPGRGP